MRTDNYPDGSRHRCNGCKFQDDCEYAYNYNFCDDCKDGKDCSLRTVYCKAGYDIECNNGFEVEGYL